VKIAGLIRVKNEKMLIKEALDHLAKFCDEIYVYDDQSDDGTLEEVLLHKKVRGVIANKNWQPDKNKKDPLELARKTQELLTFAKSAVCPDWFIYLDADERFEEGFEKKLPQLLRRKDFDAICFELYDFYITEKDKNHKYKGDITKIRPFCGTEYRIQEIIFRNIPQVFVPDFAHREFYGFQKNRVLYSNYKIRHYGKAKTIKDFDRKIDFYIKYRQSYRQKMKKRKGKAVHSNLSDFGKIVLWADLIKNPQLKGKELYRFDPTKAKNSFYSIIEPIIKKVFAKLAN
jgi:glycosyltransferase involved in cell wall biosynthesis